MVRAPPDPLGAGSDEALDGDIAQGLRGFAGGGAPGNGVIDLRFTVSSIVDSGAEILAYWTAVRLR